VKGLFGSQQLAGDGNESKLPTQSRATCVDPPASSAVLVLPAVQQRERVPRKNQRGVMTA
jgi:hypothetical protein